MNDQEFDYTDYDPLKEALKTEEEEVFYLVSASNYPGLDDPFYSAFHPATVIGAQERKRMRQSLYPAVYTPGRRADFQKWKGAWRLIKSEVIQNHLTAYQIAKKIDNNKTLKDKMKELPTSGDTLKLIIDAGLAGMLDD